MACDYWEYQGKKYSQLAIVAGEITPDFSKPQKKDDGWDEPVIQDDVIPF